jgi:hypothetical protein
MQDVENDDRVGLRMSAEGDHPFRSKAIAHFADGDQPEPAVIA